MSISSSAPWLKYYGNTPHHLTYPKESLYGMVRKAAEKVPQKLRL